MGPCEMFRIDIRECGLYTGKRLTLRIRGEWILRRE
jgi:hypothetical protein